MPSTNALSLITRALRVIGVCAEEEVPTAAQGMDGFDHLQDLMDAFKTQRLLIPTLLRTAIPLASGKPSYTLGLGGDINIEWVETIEWARLIQNTTAPTPIETPLAILRDEQFQAVRQKTMVSSYPQSIYYDHGFQSVTTGGVTVKGLGLVWVFPIPTLGTSALALYTPVAFPEFTDLSTSYVFPPGWVRVLRLKLAKALASEYGATFPSEDELSEAWADVKRVNQRPRELKSDYPDASTSRRHVYDIYSDL